MKYLIPLMLLMHFYLLHLLLMIIQIHQNDLLLINKYILPKFNISNFGQALSKNASINAFNPLAIIKLSHKFKCFNCKQAPDNNA